MAEFSLQAALRAIKARNAEAQNTLPIGRQIDPENPQYRIARAQAYEDAAQEQLAYLRNEPQTELVKRRLDNLMDRLGELAAEQGDYARAVTISKTPERREHYREIVKAIRRKDDRNCKCEPDLVVDRVNKTEFRVPAIMTVDRIVSKDGRLLNLDKCRRCSFMNAR